jgi:CheY-like chemotaxis protein
VRVAADDAEEQRESGDAGRKDSKVCDREAEEPDLIITDITMPHLSGTPDQEESTRN